jgi:hypothetical protein
VKQRTESVAFNPNTRQLFAQPRTIRTDTGSVEGSEVFVFAEAGESRLPCCHWQTAPSLQGGWSRCPTIACCLERRAACSK